MRIRSAVLGSSLLTVPACMEQNFQSWNAAEVASDTEPVLRLEPGQHDFGSPWLGCEREQTFRLHNDGDDDLLVSALEFETGSAELALHGADQFPLTIAPGELATVSVTYSGTDLRDDFGRIVAVSDDPVHPRAGADVHGVARSPGEVVDAFDQPVQPESDLLVVLDDSGSMREEQLALAGNFQQFMDALVAAHADFHVALITTDASAFVGPMVTTATPDPVGTFTAQVLSVGTQGSPEERPLDMAVEATSPGGAAAPGGAFFRDDAMLGVIVVTDEPDEFSSPTPTQFVDHLLALKGGDPDLVRVHAIGGDVPVPACREASHASVPLDQVVALAGGLFVSVCGDWGASLTAVATGSVVPLADTFALSREPFLPTLRVTVDGVEVKAGWDYDPVARAVVFDAASVPPSESHVELRYDPRADCGEDADTDTGGPPS